MDDNALFTKRMREYRGKIFRLIGRFVSDICTQEDLMQVTFMKAWLVRETFRDEAAYSTWLHRIAVNTCLNFIMWRKNKINSSCYNYAQIENLADELDIESDQIHKERMDFILKAVNNLPEHLRTTFILTALYSLSYNEVAKMMAVPIGTVRSRLHRAKFVLKEELSKPPFKM